MNREQILNLTAMPPSAPSYPKGPYRFYNREYMLITYETDPAILRAMVPEPLEPEGENLVTYEYMNMLDSGQGFGSYSESGLVIPCLYNGEKVNFTAQMYLNCEPPTTGGREIWGFPKKYGEPKLEVVHETLVGTLHYGGQLVSMGTMGYKHNNLLDPTNPNNQGEKAIKEKLGKKQFNLKWLPDVDGKPAIAQLVSYQMTDIELKFAFGGPARLHLVPHVNAPVADVPVKRIVSAAHFMADITLPYGNVEYDYLNG